MKQKRKDIPELKKSSAPVYRVAMFELRAPRSVLIKGFYNSGPALGCCLALYNRSGSSQESCLASVVALDSFYLLYGVEAGAFDLEKRVGYWWPVPTPTQRGEEGYTSRIIALELAAILCEEFGT